MSEKARILQHAECRFVFHEKFLRTMKKTATALALTVLAFLSACKPNADVPEPDSYRYEPVSLVLKDIEFGQVPLVISYKNVINERTNQVINLSEGNTTLDLTSVREAVEAFKTAQPNYALYFRIEIRPNQSDAVLADGSRKIRAGCLCEVDLTKGINVGGPLITAKDPNTSWEFITAEVQKALRDVLVPRLRRGESLKVILAVYDFNRFSSDPTAFGPFDGSTTKPYAEGGSRVVYRGWNVELK